MTYDGFVIAAVVSELRRWLIGGRIQKIRQHNDTDITLEIRSLGATYLLFFSVDPSFPRLYVASSVPSSERQAPEFCMVMRKYLEGTYVSEIQQVGFDRVIRIVTTSTNNPDNILIMEIMGKHSNLVLIDEHAKILGAIKHVGSTMSRARQILPGRAYTVAPGPIKSDLRTLNQSDFERLFKSAFEQPPTCDEAAVWLMHSCSGFGPFLAQEIVKRAGCESAVEVADLWPVFDELKQMVLEESFLPVLMTGPAGAGSVVYPAPSVQYDADNQHSKGSMNETLDILFRTLITRTKLEDERKQTLTAITRSITGRQKTIQSIDRTIKESAQADRYRQIGELILSSLNDIETGAKSATLTNYFEADMPEIDVELDEKLTPQQNAERYFKRYHKAKDSIVSANARKIVISEELADLDYALRQAQSAKLVNELKDIRKLLQAKDLLRTDSIAAKKPVADFDGYRIRRIMTAEGWEILYGETAQANDHLSLHVSRPNDMWLHTRSITGAHVIIRTAGHSADVPRSVLLQAAKIAALNSDAKHSSLVPVDYTFRKFVRKPRSSAAGYVTYRNEKTIDINPRS